MTTYTINSVIGNTAGSEKFVCTNNNTGTTTNLGGPFIYFDAAGTVKLNTDPDPVGANLGYPINEFNSVQWNYAQKLRYDCDIKKDANISPSAVAKIVPTLGGYPMQTWNKKPTIQVVYPPNKDDLIEIITSHLTVEPMLFHKEWTKKNMLSTLDAYLTIHLSQRTIILYCRLTGFISTFWP